MKTKRFLLPLTLVLLFPSCSHMPKPAMLNDDTTVGRWIGWYADGFGTYILDLDATKTGRLAFFEGTSPVNLYQVESWQLDKKSIVIKLNSSASERLSISGKAGGSRIQLNLKSEKRWERDVTLFRGVVLTNGLNRVLGALAATKQN